MTNNKDAKSMLAYMENQLSFMENFMEYGEKVKAFRNFFKIVEENHAVSNENVLECVSKANAAMKDVYDNVKEQLGIGPDVMIKKSTFYRNAEALAKMVNDDNIHILESVAEMICDYHTESLSLGIAYDGLETIMDEKQEELYFELVHTLGEVFALSSDLCADVSYDFEADEAERL